MVGLRQYGLLFLLVIVNDIAGAEISLENPVRPVVEDEIKSLPELKEELNFKQYSGFVEAGSSKPNEGKFFHYWFVESQSKPAEDPLVIWLNGGPGCSSVSNLLRTNGPIQINSEGKVVRNPFSWNKKANIVYMDTPIGTGLSYTNSDKNLKLDDDTSLENNFYAVKKFFEKFPHLENRKLFLVGESYAAVYLSMLANKLMTETQFNLKGLFIGNGFTDAKRLGESLVYYSYYHGLIDEETWRGISTYCCDNNTPGHKNCHFAATSIKCVQYVEQLSALILSPQPGLNPQNIYEYCPSILNGTQASLMSEDSRRAKLDDANQQEVERGLLIGALESLMGTRMNITTNRVADFLLSGEHVNYCASSIKSTTYLVNYMNREDVRQALNIPDRLTKPFQHCSPQIYRNYKQIYPYLKGGISKYIEALLDSPKKIKVTLYNGDVDLISNFIGNEWFVEDLKREVKSIHRPWYSNQKIAGFGKEYQGVSYFTIKGAGHSPPLDRPEESMTVFEVFIEALAR